MEFTTSDLILIHNLLKQDGDYFKDSHPNISADRYKLAEKCKLEVEKRDTNFLKEG
jgi:hypothetical protein